MADFRRFFKLFGMPADGSLVPRRGLEPPRPCERQHLKLVRLPIPPSGHEKEVGARVRGRPSACQRGACARPRATEARGAAMTVKTDRLITLFGGGGFLGRYVAQALFKAGARVRIAEREPKRAFFLKPLVRARPDPVPPRRPRRQGRGRRRRPRRRRGGQPGRHPQGRFPTPSMSRAPATSPRPPPRPASRALVHVSAIGADPESESAYGRSKGEGEAAVRAAFPAATIIRPSIAFGREDDFVNRFARMAQLLPVLPVIRGALAAPAGPRRRSRQGDRPGRARARALMPARPTSSAARR